MMIIFRFIYNLLLLLLLPLLFLRLLSRSYKISAYRQRWLERIGIFKAPAKKHGIWVHAVSVGEFISVIPLIRKLQQQYPDELITVTTTTVTGSAQVKKHLAETVFHVYLPYDSIFGMQGFLTKVQPKLCIILETELWLNMLFCCQQRNIPVFIINARISDNSFCKYKKIRWLMQAMLQQVTKVMAQSTLDGERFLQLGLAAEKLTIPGNIKYDITIAEPQLQLGQALKQTLGSRLVWIAASTHEGEEEQILTVFQQLAKQIPGLLLILVPRHPERFATVAQLVTLSQLTMVTRSSGVACNFATQVLLLDTMGELGIFYQVADIAFVGGSLVAVGGHNMLEPAAAGLPIISGPNIANFLEISQQLIAAEAMVIVQNTFELQEILEKWLLSATTRQLIGKRAKKVVANNQGATLKILTAINNTWLQLNK